VGIVQKTRVAEQNFNPRYGARLGFPVHVPILNDKITARMWSHGGRLADVFIANIPEHPSGSDFFNISKLLSAEGRMKSTWFNLYGVAPQERGWFTSHNYNKKEGSCYLGRVLLSMSLTPNE